VLPKPDPMADEDVELPELPEPAELPEFEPELDDDGGALLDPPPNLLVAALNAVDAFGADLELDVEALDELDVDEEEPPDVADPAVGPVPDEGSRPLPLRFPTRRGVTRET
jgi:hypothetical protein